MEVKSPISIRVGERSELDRKFAQCIESLPEGINLSEIDDLKEQVERQAAILRGLEAKIKTGIIIEKPKEGDVHETTKTVDEEKVKRIQELAASMTDW